MKEEIKECSFKPKVSPKSRMLLQDTSNLMQQSQKVEETFNNLYQDAKVRKQMKSDKTTEEVDYEKNLGELTFHPNVKR